VLLGWWNDVGPNDVCGTHLVRYSEVCQGISQ